MELFKDKHELKNWLEALIDISAWGEQSKDLEDLWGEYQAGECSLELRDGRVVRVVRGVGACLWRPESPGRTGLFLQETEQRFKAGFVSYRDLEMSIGEKCLSGEDPKVALERAFDEELGLAVELELHKPLIQSTLLESGSYPGTWREYRTEIWHLRMPDAGFKPEYREAQDKKTSLWHWRRLPFGVEMPELNGWIVRLRLADDDKI